jgi:hypothetical protein
MTCAMGYETEFDAPLDPSLDCMCAASCEPHRHEPNHIVLCLHDGETDHEHCPNAHTKMCFGSEELGARLSANLLTCRRCGETVPSYSATFDLVPLHNRPS